MKVKMDFVTNSSSSSFLMTLPDSFDIIKYLDRMEFHEFEHFIGFEDEFGCGTIEKFKENITDLFNDLKNGYPVGEGNYDDSTFCESVDIILSNNFIIEKYNSASDQGIIINIGTEKCLDKIKKIKKMETMKYYKITHKDEKHCDREYHDGLNIDNIQLNRDWKLGGIHFSREDILDFIDYGYWIREVTIPEGEEVYENPGEPKSWKASSIILGKRRKIDLKVIKELVKEGANINIENKYILKWASLNGYLDIIKYLFEKGMDVSPHIDDALLWASNNGNLDIIKFLVEHGVDIHYNNDSSLIWSINNDHIDIVKYLVEYGADVNVENGEPLYVASENGYLDIVKYLVEHGSDVCGNSNKSLIFASDEGHLEVVKYLIGQGADVHAGDDCALRYASESGHLSVVIYLIEKGANIYSDNERALTSAFDNGHLDVVKYLKNLQRGNNSEIL